MIDGSVLQSAQKCFEKKSRVVVKMVVSIACEEKNEFIVMSNVNMERSM